ncbi:YceI family protein [Halobacteriovorax sp. HLS]|uniref:YceI family protein n=1 Tax=Halobacteriovorax sp. HLS TaxID=2234000 RepID=UPI000FDB4B45|nr:YceI family protein [Halobacteriovorax sp. HLS]
MKLFFILVLMINTTYAATMNMKINFNASTNVPGMNISGEALQEISGNIELTDKKINKVNVSFESTSLTTGMQLRDEHLHKMLKKSKLEFINTSECLFEDSKCEMEGTFSIAYKKIKSKFLITREGETLLCSIIIKLSDLFLKKPSFAGVSVNDEVNVTIEGTVK